MEAGNQHYLRSRDANDVTVVGLGVCVRFSGVLIMLGVRRPTKNTSRRCDGFLEIRSARLNFGRRLQNLDRDILGK